MATRKTGEKSESAGKGGSEGAATGKKVAPPAKGATPNALQKQLNPSPELAPIVGSHPIARGEAVSKMWEYIKAHNLQNPEDKREIVADEALKKVFGKDKVSMFEMNKHLARHLT